MVSYSFIAVVLTFVFQTLATHILTTHEYGILAKWITDIGYLSVFFILGLDSSLLYHAKLGESIERNITKNIIVYFTMLVLSLIAISILQVDKLYYITLSISIFFIAIVGLVRASYQFNQNFKVYNILSIIKPLFILIAFLLLFFKGEIVNYQTALIIYSLMSLIASVCIVLIYLKNNTFYLADSKILDKSYYSYGIRSILNKVLSLTLYASTVYCITALLDFQIVAYFFVASSISKIVWVVPDSVGNLLYPRFLKIHSKKDDEIALNEMYYYAQVVFIINIACIMLFFLLGPTVLSILYDSTYSVNYFPILILLFGNQGMVYYKLISRYLASKNYWKPLYLSLAVGVFTNVISNYILLERFGLIGAAISTSLSFWACGLTISFFVRDSLFKFLNLESLYRSFTNKKVLKV